jgi:hypothetical protein
MAVTSTRIVRIGFSGDVVAPDLTYAAADNAASPGMIETKALVSGFNSITVPTDSESVTIIPPSANVVTLTLKGVTGDTGIGIHLTDPTVIGLAAAQSTIGITTSDVVTVRLIWA